jgi:hypothetical protein
MKKKHMKIKILSFALAALFFTACKKENLAPIPQTALSDAVAFQSPERVAQQVNGMYAAVKSGQFYGGRYIVYNEIRGEDHLNQTQNGVTGFQTWNFTVTPTTNEVQNLWGAAYQAINRINVVLLGLETSPISDQLKNQYRGEARFLRGLSYFALVTMYGRPFWDGNGDKPGVPLYLEPQVSSGSNERARATVAQVYTQILEDLNFAEANLPATYANATLNTTRAHKNTAIAFKTRVYLNMRRYADVITEANKIVPTNAPFVAPTGVQHRLEANVANLYGASPTLGTEIIFGFPFSTLDLPGTQNSLNQYYSPSPAGNGDYSLNPSGIVANTGWRTTDARRNFIGTSGTRTILRKFTSNTDLVPIIRYAEVMLNLAEALARTNGLNTRAVALLNAVRQRSDATMVLAPATAQELIDMILTERRIEFLGEGLRALDIMRLGLTFPAKGVAPAIAPSDAQYIWPIPLSELLVNKAAQQNTGY